MVRRFRCCHRKGLWGGTTPPPPPIAEEAPVCPLPGKEIRKEALKHLSIVLRGFEKILLGHFPGVDLPTLSELLVATVNRLLVIIDNHNSFFPHLMFAAQSLCTLI